VPAESLLKEVEDQHRKTLELLEAEYASKRAELVKRRDEELSHIKESSRIQAQSLSERERTRIIGAAKLQAKKMIFDATEKMLEANVSSLQRVMAELAQSKEYEDLLARMAKHASRRLDGRMAVVCRPADSPIFSELGIRIASSKLNSIGGFKAESEDGKLELDLTFEEILRNNEEKVRALILGKE
jgi:vacuolar-type H+-ATPase subunit E/Vma4